MAPPPADRTLDDPQALPGGGTANTGTPATHTSTPATPAAPEAQGRPGLTIPGGAARADVAARYRVTARHAQGGLGRIMLAVDQRLGRPVAIKEGLKQGASAEARFLEEARITAGLEHPGIVPVHDVGRWPEGEPFYVMKFVEGRPFKHVLQECTTLDSRLTLLPNVQAVVDALAYAHSRRVVHLDLKPSNVLVGQHGETVVVDWGMARDLQAQEDGSAAPVVSAGGTPAYMAPEQAGGQMVDTRTDVYALGALLYELLTGRAPYVGTPEAVVDAVLAGPPLPAARLQPGIPRDLLAIVGKAMARDPAQRYPHAGALGADLRAFQNGQIVTARTYAPWVLLARWVRRYRALLAVAGVATVLLAVGGATAVGRVVEARNEAQQRARALTLVEARGATTTDPTLALAWLHTLGPRPGALLETAAQDLAVQALANGVARDVWHLPHRNPTALMFSPDAKTLVVATMDAAFTGTNVTALDVEAGTFTARAAFPGPLRGVTLRLDGSLQLPELPSQHPALFDDGWLQAVMGPHGASCVPRAGGWRAETTAEGPVQVQTLAAGEGRTLAVPAPVSQLVCDRGGKALAVVLQDGRVGVWKPGRSRLELVGPLGLRATCAGFDAAGSLWLGMERGAVMQVGDAFAAAVAPVLHQPPWEADAAWLLPHPAAEGQLAVMNTHGGIWLLGERAVPLLDRGAVSARFMAPDSTLLVGTETGHMQVYARGALQQDLRGLPARVTQVASSADGRRAAAAAEDGELRIFELAPRQTARESGQGPMGACAVAAGPDSVPLVLARDGALTVGNDPAARRGLPALAPWAGPGGLLAVGQQDGSVLLLGPSGGAPVTVLPLHRGAPVVSGLAPDGQLWASASGDGTLQLLELTGRRVVRTLPLGSAPLALAPAAQGRGAYVLLADSTLAYVDALQSPPTAVVAPQGVVLLAATAPGVVAATRTGDLHLLSPTGQVLAQAPAHNGPIHHLVASPNLQRAVTAGMDQTLALWRVDPAGLTLLGRLPSDVTALSFSADGSRLAVGDRAGLVRILDAQDGHVCGAWHLPDAVAGLALTATVLHAVTRAGLWRTLDATVDAPTQLPQLLHATRARIQALGQLGTNAPPF